VRRRAHLSRFFHQQRQQKPRGPKKELASAAAALVATWLCVINCWVVPLPRKKKNKTSWAELDDGGGRRRWFLGWECRGPLLVGVSGVAVQTIRTPARLSLSQQPSSF
jgi:hypothetical protein